MTHKGLAESKEETVIIAFISRAWSSKREQEESKHCETLRHLTRSRSPTDSTGTASYSLAVLSSTPATASKLMARETDPGACACGVGAGCFLDGISSVGPTRVED